jgi:exopolyphosphatase/guanosine-5'-triphosphate,3'-diphosphate pyrophosphatase
LTVPSGTRRAVIDVGSNSVLLTVCERDSGGWQETFASSAVTGLGTDTKKTGVLRDDAIERTLAAVASAYEDARSRDADVRAYATMAARIATNRSAFLEAALAQGTPIQVISGDEEAALGAQCVFTDPLFASSARITVVDVGGHSTEISTGAKRGEWVSEFARSFPIGTLSIKSTSLQDESPSGPELLRAAVQIDDAFGFCYVKDAVGDVVALGASAINLVTIRDGIDPWDPVIVHGRYLDFEETSKLAASLSRLTETERARLPGIEPGREGTVHIGALILERSLQAVRALGCRVSVRGWRHAMLDAWL